MSWKFATIAQKHSILVDMFKSDHNSESQFKGCSKKACKLSCVLRGRGVVGGGQSDGQKKFIIQVNNVRSTVGALRDILYWILPVSYKILQYIYLMVLNFPGK